MTFWKKSRTPLNKALKEFYKRKVEEKCQIDIWHNDQVVAQIFFAGTFKESHHFSNDKDIAIVSKERVSKDVIDELKLDFGNVGDNRKIVFCNRKQVDVEHLALAMIKESLGNTDKEISMNVLLNCY